MRFLFKATLLIFSVVMLVIVTFLPALSSAQVLLQQSDLVYQGAFRLPNGTTDQTSFSYGGTALAHNPANNSLFLVGHDWYQLTAEISIPTLVNSTNLNSLNTATLLQPLTDVTNGKASNVGSGTYKMGGLLPYGGQLYSSVYLYYDASASQTLSHYVSSPNLSAHNAQGPFQVGSWAGIVSGYMALIPSEWQSAFGGPALTGNCCLSIISRTSYGPAASVFNPRDVGVKNPVPATPILYYPSAHPLEPYGAAGSHYLFGGTTGIHGLVFPSGTRSLLFIGRQGTGPYCYGEGTSDPSLNNQPVPGESGVIYCYDLASSSKGEHAYPYKYQIWAYDANDLLAVKNGQKNPWDVQPYGVWNFNLALESTGSGHTIGGAAYDPATQRIYISQSCESSGCNPVIHAFKVNGAGGGETAPPAAPQRLKMR
jgi:hypothetical protein